MTNEQKAVKAFAIFLACMIIFSIFSAIVSGISWMFFWVDDEDGEYSSETIDYDNITKLSIDAGTLNLEIYEGSEFKVERKNLKSRVDIDTRKDTLKIEEISHGIWNTRHGGTLIVTVPKDITLDELEIDMGAGTVTISDIESYKFDFDQGAGTLTMTNCKFSHTDIDGGVGKIQVKNSVLDNLDLDSGVGEVNIEGKIGGRSEIDGGVGAITLMLIDSSENYTLNVEKGIGSITVDGESKSGRVGNGTSYIDIEGGVGAINIKFSTQE